jgi:hypothetical protein
MHRQQRDVLLRAESQQRDAQQRAMRQVERELRLIDGEPSCGRVALLLRYMLKLDHRQPQFHRGRDELYGLPLNRREGRA